MPECQRCGSPKPEMHPAVQHEGEVHLCHDAFHGTHKLAPLAEAVADEATFLIARTLNKSRADSEAARRRWWRVYSAFPELYRDAAARCWQRRIVEARKVA